MKLIIMGPPGTGKGTHATHLQNKYGLQIIGTGNILRQEVEKKTELGEKIKATMDAGHLVDDAIVIEVVKKRIKLIKSYILDGFPRNTEQALALKNFLKERGEHLDTVIYIETSEQELTERLSGRLVCNKCGRVYQIRTMPPQMTGVCDTCKQSLTHREDDAPEVIKKRIETYREQTEPLLEFYRDEDILKTVNGNQDPESVFADIIGVLEQI